MFLKKNDQMEISIDFIHANADQPRKVFENRELLELKDSIVEFGVIQPLIVKRRGKDDYLLIAGERRLRAATLAGLKKVPAVVREADEKDVALLALVENIQRESLNYMEEAEAYRRLMEDYNLTQVEIAKRVGKRQSTISNKIRLLSLPEDIQKVLADNQLSERHARALLKITDPSIRKQVLQRIVAHNLNVKQSERLIEDILQKHESDRKRDDKIRYINYKIYVNTLKKAFTAIQEAEKKAEYHQEDKGDYLEVKIIIPKTGSMPRSTMA
ncbi:MAG: ParB/RepB/Spo0J family partition protein [Anaerovorax sp.]